MKKPSIKIDCIKRYHIHFVTCRKSDYIKNDRLKSERINLDHIKSVSIKNDRVKFVTNKK